MIKIFVLNEAGKVPTEEALRQTLRGLYEYDPMPGEDHTRIFSGPVWHQPKNLLAELEPTSRVVRVYNITPSSHDEQYVSGPGAIRLFKKKLKKLPPDAPPKDVCDLLAGMDQ